MGAGAPFPPAPSKAGKKYYVPGKIFTEAGMPSGIYCGAACAEAKFPMGYTWQNTVPGSIYGFADLEEAAIFWFGRNENKKKWTLQLWK